MYKVLKVFMLFGVLLFSSSALAAEQEIMILKLGLGDTIDADAGAYALKFKKLIEERTDNKVSIKIFPGTTLGNEIIMLKDVRRGALDMCLVGIGNAVPISPSLGAYTLPYIFSDEESVVKATTGKIFDSFNKRSIDQSGLRVLGYCYTNYRHLTNSIRPVKNLEDLRGLRIRVPDNEIFLATYKAWGANPVTIEWTRTYTSLQQNIVDGQDNPYVVNLTTRFVEVQKYLTELSYHYSLQPLFISEKHLKRFSPELQKILIESGMEAQLYMIDWQKKHSEKAKQQTIEEGLEITELSEEEEERWKKVAVEEVWPKFYKFVGGKEVVDEIQKAIAE